MLTEPRMISVSEVYVSGLPGKVVFISDLHVKESNLDFLEEVVLKINEIEPDAVLMGGDFIGSYPESVIYLDFLSKINAPMYAVLGNHDYHSLTGRDEFMREYYNSGMINLDVEGYDVSALCDGSNDYEYASVVSERLKKLGISVLRNEYSYVDLSGGRVLLVGLEDCLAGMTKVPDYPKDAGTYIVMLLHEPECMADWDYDLMLCGHTHGGQVSFPLIGGPGEWLGYYMYSGEIQGEGKKAYISRGVGTNSYNYPLIHGFELRFMRQPEIVVLKGG
ncbi:metallophosphoesterase [Methanochimaera problematica]|nr:metallophosphoesterase [Methanoplanus sp. FWC-SCC4]